MKFHTNMFGWEYVWRDFADAFGGEVITDGKAQDATILSLNVPATDKTSTITITPTSAGTTAVVHYEPAGSFMFSLRTEKFIHQFGKVLGLQDLQVGDKLFDNKFLIQSNDEAVLKFVFADPNLRQLILDEEISELRMYADSHAFDARWVVPAGQHVLIYSRTTLMDKFEQLEATYKILQAIVERLVESKAIGLGPETPPENGGRLHSPLLNNRP